MFRGLNGELSAEWEDVNAERIAAEVVFEQRLPQMILLAILAEKAKRTLAAANALRVTALMKYAFLLQMEGASKQRFYEFVPYHYGPFAKSLYADLEALAAAGVVSLHTQEDDKSAISIVNAEKAEEALEELPDEVREDVTAILDGYGHFDHTRLLKTVYEKYPSYAKNTRLTHLKPKRKRKTAGTED